MKKIPTAKKYSEAFKRQMVRDLEKGLITASEVRRRYGVSGSMTITRWLTKYGKAEKVARGEVAAPKSIESRRVLFLEQKNRELEQALARLTIENVALESLIEEAQCHTGIDLKKTFGSGR